MKKNFRSFFQSIMTELQKGCHSIVGTAFDDDKFLPTSLRRNACFNADTVHGCCMALCSSRGYRCQSAAKYAVQIKNKEIQDASCEEIIVTPEQYASVKGKVRTTSEGTLLLCGVHFQRVKKQGSVWAAVVKNIVGKTGWSVCTGAITAAAVAAVGSVAPAMMPAMLVGGAVQSAVDATLQKAAEELSGEVVESAGKMLKKKKVVQ